MGNAGSTASFYLGHDKVPFTPGRGLNVVVINPLTWVEESCTNYDVWTDKKAERLFKTAMDYLPNGHVVLVAVRDTGLEQLGVDGLQALQSLGAGIQASDLAWSAAFRQ